MPRENRPTLQPQAVLQRLNTNVPRYVPTTVAFGGGGRNWAVEEDDAFANPTFFLDEEDNNYEWYPSELKQRKDKGKVKEYKPSPECKQAISEIVGDIVGDEMVRLRQFYSARINLIDNGAIDELFDILHNDRDRDISFKLQNISSIWHQFISGSVLNSREHRELLFAIEEKAREKYDINYSKYQFYPRLKSKMTYGNTKLLDEILTITQLDKGKVIWK